MALREELAFVRRYLDLQAVRFGDRLEVRYAVPETCLDATVPFLLLQVTARLPQPSRPGGNP